MTRQSKSRTAANGAGEHAAADLALRQPPLMREVERMRKALAEHRRAVELRDGRRAKR